MKLQSQWTYFAHVLGSPNGAPREYQGIRALGLGPNFPSSCKIASLKNFFIAFNSLLKSDKGSRPEVFYKKVFLIFFPQNSQEYTCTGVS